MWDGNARQIGSDRLAEAASFGAKRMVQKVSLAEFASKRRLGQLW